MGITVHELVVEKLNALAKLKAFDTAKFVDAALLQYVAEGALDQVQYAMLRETLKRAGEVATVTNEAATNLEKEIKEAVITLGETIQGDELKAAPVKGRVTWDAKALEGYAVSNPTILALRKVGEPTARISSVK